MHILAKVNSIRLNSYLVHFPSKKAGKIRLKREWKTAKADAYQSAAGVVAASSMSSSPASVMRSIIMLQKEAGA